MRSTHLRQADLNLLVVFAAVAEERNITRAASRLLLSQPAVTRALQRLRDTFHDDLLIRTSTGYEPTPKGQHLLQDLATMLPRLDRLMAGADFDPVTEDASFRIAATDHAAYLLVPPLYTSVLPKRTKVDFSFVNIPVIGNIASRPSRGRLFISTITPIASQTAGEVVPQAPRGSKKQCPTHSGHHAAPIRLAPVAENAILDDHQEATYQGPERAYPSLQHPVNCGARQSRTQPQASSRMSREFLSNCQKQTLYGEILRCVHWMHEDMECVEEFWKWRGRVADVTRGKRI
jgi:hypothetical protein